MTTLYLYEDSRARQFEPFASTRPIAEMRTGAALLRERWAAAFPGVNIALLAGRTMSDFDEPNAGHAASGRIESGSLIANARFAPALDADMARHVAGVGTYRSGGRVAAIRVEQPLDVRALEEGAGALEDLPSGAGNVDLRGWWHDEVWDFIRLLPEVLGDDLETMPRAIAGRPISQVPADATIIGDHPAVLIGDESDRATIEPHVIFDVSAGPIVVERGATVHAFTRLVGPCYIGPKVTVMGGDISTCSIGPVCKVRGEMSNTILLGYANKGHDGFIGHSYLGRWVNIGASTVTSNLKNTYGPVALWTPGGIRETGMQFLGTMFGDHVKTGIGLRLTTGTVLGAGANVYDRMPPKAVAPFSWGGGPPYSLYRFDKFIETAERMMSRRHVSLSDRARKHWSAVYQSRWSPDPGSGEPNGT